MSIQTQWILLVVAMPFIAWYAIRYGHKAGQHFWFNSQTDKKQQQYIQDGSWPRPDMMELKGK